MCLACFCTAKQVHLVPTAVPTQSYQGPKEGTQYLKYTPAIARHPGTQEKGGVSCHGLGKSGADRFSGTRKRSDRLGGRTRNASLCGPDYPCRFDEFWLINEHAHILVNQLRVCPPANSVDNDNDVDRPIRGLTMDYDVSNGRETVEYAKWHYT